MTVDLGSAEVTTCRELVTWRELVIQEVNSQQELVNKEERITYLVTEQELVIWGKFVTQRE